MDSINLPLPWTVGSGWSILPTLFFLDIWSSTNSRPQRLDDHPNSLCMPALNRLMIGSERCPQPPPRKQMPIGDRMHEAARTDDAAQHIAVQRDQRNPA